jgi:hypothetical protein
MSRTTDLAQRAVRTPLAYPITTVWAAGVMVAVGISQTWWDLPVALSILSLITLLVFLAALKAEVTTVHGLLNGQREELFERIDKLTGLLEDAGIREENNRDHPR